jgi:hypothetical protein
MTKSEEPRVVQGGRSPLFFFFFFLFLFVSLLSKANEDDFDLRKIEESPFHTSFSAAVLNARHANGAGAFLGKKTHPPEDGRPHGVSAAAANSVLYGTKDSARADSPGSTSQPAI